MIIVQKESARTTYDREAARIKALAQWHPWFAWFPVWVDDGLSRRLLWLETIQRRCVYPSRGGFFTEYRAAGDSRR